MARILKLSQLKEAGFCKSSQRLFYNRFGKKTTVTKARVVRYAMVFDWYCGIELIADYEQRVLFTQKATEAYSVRGKIYHAIADRYERDYIKLCDRLCGGWIKHNTFDRKFKVLVKERKEAKGAANMNFRRSLAIPFYEAYNGKL